MKKYTALLLVLSFSILLYGQKYDYQWPFGYGANLENSFGFSLLDFNDQSTTVFPFFETDEYEIGDAGSFICDSQGQLMLMTNNCAILDRNFNIIEGTDTLTPGVIYNENCHFSNWIADYPSGQCSLFMPEMGNDSVFYVINKDFEILITGEDVISRNTYLSKIVRREDTSFYLKEKRILIDDMPVITRSTTACIHADGQRWWTWSIKYNSNRFYKFLIGGDSIVEGPFIQEIGVDLKSLDTGLGQVTFSPDGRHLAINSESYGVLLYDFDNATGTLSNFRSIPYPNMHNVAQGLVFSPSSRFIYTSTAENMYQIDIEEPDTSQRVYHIGHYRSQAEDGWPVGLGNMYLGPDCRIYVAPGSTTWYIHVIQHPDEKGADCDFQERAIRAPTNVNFHFPNIPMYRFGGNCDSSIGWGIVSEVSPATHDKNPSIRLYPNPAREVLTVEVPNGYEPPPFDIDFFNVLGQKVFSYKIEQSNSSLNIRGLPRGVFFYAIRKDGRLLDTGQLSLVD